MKKNSEEHKSEVLAIERVSSMPYLEKWRRDDDDNDPQPATRLNHKGMTMSSALH